MMESWRALLSRKERDLQRSAKAGREKKEASWVPAALTGWYEDDGLSAEDETETLSTDEDAGSTEREDQEFVREWQLHAEKQRQRQQRQERLAGRVRVGAVPSPQPRP